MPAPGYFEIHADDIGRAMKFYETVFGWNFKSFGKSPAGEYWMIDTSVPGAMMGGLLGRPGCLAEGQGPNAFVVTINVDSVDNCVRKCLEAGATIAKPKMAIPGIGWQAYLMDTEKNIFGLHQSDSSAA